ncbi:MAG: aminotransferase class III-fold pyridoxal phosphate-dependent enzyme [bacterium]
MHPCLSQDEARRLLEQHYGLTGDLHALPGERDQNFQLQAPDGTSKVFKVVAASASAESLRTEVQAMQHLGARLGNSVSSPIADLHGEFVPEVPRSDGSSCFLRVQTWVPGIPLAQFRPQTPELLHELGSLMGQVASALKELDLPDPHPELPWHPEQAFATVQRSTPLISEAFLRESLEHLLAFYQQHGLPRQDDLPRSLIQNDANDYNILISGGLKQPPELGLIDFGDMVVSWTCAEAAVTLAYALLGPGSPWATLQAVLSGFHRSHALSEAEAEFVWPMALMRLGLSTVMAARQIQEQPDNEYLLISQQPIRVFLARLKELRLEEGLARARHACGHPPTRRSFPLRNSLERLGSHPVMGQPLTPDNTLLLPLGVGSPTGEWFRGEVAEQSARVESALRESGKSFALGLYDEARLCYTAPEFRQGPESRTIHLGLDVFAPSGTPLHAPLDGVFVTVHDNAQEQNYGPTLMLEHRDSAGEPFYTLYGHLDPGCLERWRPGDSVPAGAEMAHIGAPPRNGNWPSHLHLQVMSHRLGWEEDFPGVALPSEREFWKTLCPNPHLLLGLPEASWTQPVERPPDLLSRRRQVLGRNLSLSYQQPLTILQGEGAYLIDSEGRRFVDGVNNVAHVGHCHPRVVHALRQQSGLLNTNTRYLHPELVEYAQRLCDRFPDPLNVCILVCTGSEANELALRLARAKTQAQGMVVVDVGYHGHTNTLIDLSPYKHNGPGGRGAPNWVRTAPMPDVFRGQYREAHPEPGKAYALHVAEHAQALEKSGHGLAGFICESILSCGGQIVLPEGYLREAYAAVRQLGGVCIADEVQVGFGRVGKAFWGFELQGVVPDIVTLGKPIGNGHPLAAVVTTEAIAEAFANGMEYFNTFGGNPVSAAVGNAVLDVIEQEALQSRAERLGASLLVRWKELASGCPFLGQVRGEGLFLGMEFVSDPQQRTPCAARATYIVERMKAYGFLLSTDGPDHNVIKFKPPMVLPDFEAERLCKALEQVLQEAPLQLPASRTT